MALQCRAVRRLLAVFLMGCSSTNTEPAAQADTGVDTAVLAPIEGLTDESAGEDYLEVMRANAATLRQGQSCRRERTFERHEIDTAHALRDCLHRG